MNLLRTRIDELIFWYRRGDSYVGGRIALGKYEEYETKLLLRQLDSNSVAVDIGANIGYYTLQMAKICKKVYAIEPDKDNFEILKKNVENNKLNNVVLINAAAGAKKEKLTLRKSSSNYGDHRLINKDCHVATVDAPRNDVTVNCVRLDDILINEQKIDLIKIDTQGWEPEVIEGGKKIIKRDSPILFMEYWPSAYKEAKLNANKMMLFLKNRYKNIEKINNNLNIIQNEITVDESTGYADIILTNKRTDFWGRFGDIRVKKLIKMIIGVK